MNHATTESPFHLSKRRKPRDTALGATIRLFRGSRKQIELASAAKFHPATWSLYEAGRRIPTRESLERIQRALEVTAPEFERAYWRFKRRNAAQHAAADTPAEIDGDPQLRNLRSALAALVGPLEQLFLWLRQPE
ncbi:MAG: helix-turn-helix transcriptional regulator [Nitrospiraceae bacterium]|nr:helix-turn-helix transcriptional regulator [Nitrospiraceae bacterium]